MCMRLFCVANEHIIKISTISTLLVLFSPLLSA